MHRRLHITTLRPLRGALVLVLAAILVSQLISACASAPAPTALPAPDQSESTKSEPDQAVASLGSQRPATEPSGEKLQDLASDPFEIRLGSGDLVEMKVFGLPELDQELRVAMDGTVSIPPLGSVSVQGLSVDEAARTIQQKFIDGQLVNNPQITVSIKESANSGVSVQGAVAKPGVYQLAGPTTVLEILLEAGGLSPEASGSRIFVLREDEDGTSARTEIDSERLFDQGDLSQNLSLLPGDIVLVPESRTYRLYVSGAVRNPGPISYSSGEGITLLQAITAAGGPTERANLGKVQVIRRNASGGEERLTFDVGKIKKGRLEDVPLKRNDTIVVKEWFF